MRVRRRADLRGPWMATPTARAKCTGRLIRVFVDMENDVGRFDLEE